MQVFHISLELQGSPDPHDADCYCHDLRTHARDGMDAIQNVSWLCVLSRTNDTNAVTGDDCPARASIEPSKDVRILPILEAALARAKR